MIHDMKYIGISLLFYKKEKSNYTAFIKSYIVMCNNQDDLQRQIEQIINKNKCLEYLGIEDIFYVSGSFGEGEVLGKSYIDEIVTRKGAKELLLEQKQYTYNFQINEQKEKWFLFSLIYFYHDKIDNDKLTISCYSPVFASNVKEAKMKIKKVCETEIFIEKLLPFEIDKMDYKNLNYIGIEDVAYIEENPEEYGAFDYSFNDEYKTIEEIKKILPTQKELRFN